MTAMLVSLFNSMPGHVRVDTEDEIAFAGQYGQLTPTGGGDPIPLIKERLLVGRRGESDIQLKFANVSSQHCRI